jgi:Flp pilus assembly pilin Flp
MGINPVRRGRMMEALRELHEEDGQGLVEYALILVLVAAAVVAGLTVFGGALSSAFSMVASIWP